jgi:hypothetical protein
MVLWRLQPRKPPKGVYSCPQGETTPAISAGEAVQGLTPYCRLPAVMRVIHRDRISRFLACKGGRQARSVHRRR